MKEKCIDETTKHIIEVSNNATTEMLKKVSPDEVDAFQAYTVRNLDNKLLTGSDIEQYRLVSITEDPLPLPHFFLYLHIVGFLLGNCLCPHQHSGEGWAPSLLGLVPSLIPNWGLLYLVPHSVPVCIIHHALFSMF